MVLNKNEINVVTTALVTAIHARTKTEIEQGYTGDSPLCKREDHLEKRGVR